MCQTGECIAKQRFKEDPNLQEQWATAVTNEKWTDEWSMREIPKEVALTYDFALTFAQLSGEQSSSLTSKYPEKMKVMKSILKT
jgi:hypothetical protein